MEEELPLVFPEDDERKKFIEKIDFESIMFRHIDRINHTSIKEGKTDPYITGVDQLGSLSLAYGDGTLNAELSEITDDFNKKKNEARNINLLKVQTAEKKMDAIMNFMARSGLSGRKQKTITSRRK